MRGNWELSFEAGHHGRLVHECPVRWRHFDERIGLVTCRGCGARILLTEMAETIEVTAVPPGGCRLN